MVTHINNDNKTPVNRQHRQQIESLYKNFNFNFNL